MLAQGIGQISVGGPPQYNDPVYRPQAEFNTDFSDDFAI